MNLLFEICGCFYLTIGKAIGARTVTMVLGALLLTLPLHGRQTPSDASGTAVQGGHGTTVTEGGGRPVLSYRTSTAVCVAFGHLSLCVVRGVGSPGSALSGPTTKSPQPTRTV